MGEKISDDILSESTQQICSPKLKHTPKKGLYQTCIKNCEIQILDFWQFFCSCQWEIIKSIMETAGRREKRTKIWDSGTLTTHVVYLSPSSVQGHFEVIHSVHVSQNGL